MSDVVCSTCGLPFPDGESVCPNDGNAVQVEKTAPRADPLVGATVGDYVIEARIGIGGNGVVYRGLQPQIAKPVAIKVLRPDVAADPVQVQRLLHEAQAVNSIRHRSIIDIFGFGKVPDGRHYIVMELLDGEPLDQLLERTGPLSAAQALPLLEEILSALGAAHARRVIHRDLKPSNIFVASQPDGSRYIKLLDFGLAKKSALPNAPTAQTNQGSVAGTPDYMAPEQAKGEAVGPQTDLYALGVMAFQMLTGELPFSAPTPIELLMEHLNAPPPAPSSVEVSVPPALDAWVLGLLEKDMAQRPATAEVARVDLKRISRDLVEASTHVAWRVTGEHRAPPTTQLSLPVARRSRLVPAVATIAVAALATGAFVAARLKPEPAAKPPFIVEAPPPPMPTNPPPTPARPEPSPPEPAPAEAPSPAVAPPVAPVARAPSRAVMKVQSVKTVQDRIARLEQSLRAKAGKDEPDPQALAFLNRKRLELTYPEASEKLPAITRYLDQWERTYLR
jgi:serine/threonine-protein kinase